MQLLLRARKDHPLDILLGRGSRPDRVGQGGGHAIIDPAKIRKKQGEVDNLQKELTRAHQENVRLRLEKMEVKAKFKRRTSELADFQERFLEATRCVDQIRNTFDVSREIHTKARLYDKERGATFEAMIIKILVDFANKVEGSLQDIRALVSNIPEPSQRKREAEGKATSIPGGSRWRLTQLCSSS